MVGARHRRALSLVEVLVVIGILGVLLGLTTAAVQKVRASAARARCANQMRQLALALHASHDARGALPPGWTSASGPDRYTDLGWTARVLPFVDQQPLWQEVEAAFRAVPGGTVPGGTVWEGPHATILGTPVVAFACPSDPRALTTRIPFANNLPVAFTSYLGVSGHRPFRNTGVLFPDSAVRLTDITDGTSNTLLLGERPPSADHRYGWWYRGIGQSGDGSGEMIMSARETNLVGDAPCPVGPYHFIPDRFDDPCAMFHFWSPHAGGANFAFADGSVRFLSYSADDILPALSTRAGGEAVTLPD
jgi:prepilin-type processing-associated H-X9-DG protein/prepilin-type N-terminal cleavage/methylation domain-containing protein